MYYSFESWFNMKKLSTDEILSGITELKEGMKKDEYLKENFLAVLEDAERRIKSCEWVDYTKGKPDKDIKVVFKSINHSHEDDIYVENFYEQDEFIKKDCKENGWDYKEGELFWKPFETESNLDFNVVRSKLFDLEQGFEEKEFLRKKYANLMVNIISRVESGEWYNFRGNKPVCRMKVLYKALYQDCDDYWDYGSSWFDPNIGKGKLISIAMPELFETIWWKPLEVEERVI